MNIRKIFPPLIAIVIALLIYQSYNIYAENEPVEGVTEEMTSAGGEEGGGPLPVIEGTVPPAESTEGTVPMPEEEPLLPPVEATAPVLSEEETPPLPAIEATAPLAPVEGTTPLPPGEGTVPADRKSVV